MPMTKDQILAEVMALDPKERQALADEILLSLNDDERAEIDQAWLEEARRREAEFASGRMSTSPLEDVIARVRSRVRQ